MELAHCGAALTLSVLVHALFQADLGALRKQLGDTERRLEEKERENQSLQAQVGVLQF